MQNKKPKSQPTEYLSEDILEDEFFNMFSRLLWLQKILGVSRVDAKDRFVTGPTMLQKLYTALVSSIALGTFSIAYCSYCNQHHEYEEVADVAISLYVTVSVNFICIVLYARFNNNNNANAKFHIKMQKIDRFLGVHHNKTINELSGKINNFLYVLMLVGLLIIAMLSYYGGWNIIAFVGNMWCTATTVLEITYCFNLLMYFLIRIRYLNCILLNHVEGKSARRKPRMMLYPTRNVIRYLVDPRHEYRHTETDVCFTRLFDGFLNFQDLYRFPIAVHVFSLIMISLTAVRFASFGFIKNKVTLWQQITIFGFLGASLMQTLVYVAQFELFFQEVKNTRRMAVAIMSRSIDEPLRDKAKRIINLVDLLPPRFSVYDMWHMNAEFFLNYLKVIAYLIITLLQFILL